LAAWRAKLTSAPTDAARGDKDAKNVNEGKSLTAKDGKVAKERKSFTAKGAKDAEERNSLNAKDAKDAKGTLIKTKP